MFCLNKIVCFTWNGPRKQQYQMEESALFFEKWKLTLHSYTAPFLTRLCQVRWASALQERFNILTVTAQCLAFLRSRIRFYGLDRFNACCFSYFYWIFSGTCWYSFLNMSQQNPSCSYSVILLYHVTWAVPRVSKLRTAGVSPRAPWISTDFQQVLLLQSALGSPFTLHYYCCSNGT